MSNNSSNGEPPLEPVPGIESPPAEKESETKDYSGTGEPPKDNEEPESLTKAEAFLLVVSICVSRRQRAAFGMES